MPGDAVLELHEKATIDFLLSTGEDIEVISRNLTKGAKSADIVMNNVKWEMKSPTGNGKQTVANNMKRATKQSKNIIMDARRTEMSDENIEKDIKRNLKMMKSVKRIFMINKRGERVDFL